MNRFNIITVTLICAAIIPVIGCQPSYTAEMTIPLVKSDAEDKKQAKPAGVYDVLAEVEKIATQSGLKPYTPPREETDLLSIADSDDLNDTPSSASRQLQRNFKHPDYPLYLSFSKQGDEILLVLNTPSEKPAKSEANLYNTIYHRLKTELPTNLNIQIIEETK